MFTLQNVQPTSLEGHDSRLSVQNVYVAVNSGRAARPAGRAYPGLPGFHPPPNPVQLTPNKTSNLQWKLLQFQNIRYIL